MTSTRKSNSCDVPWDNFKKQFAMEVVAGRIKLHVTSFALRIVAKVVPWDIARHRIMYCSTFDVTIRKRSIPLTSQLQVWMISTPTRYTYAFTLELHMCPA